MGTKRWQAPVSWQIRRGDRFVHRPPRDSPPPVPPPAPAHYVRLHPGRWTLEDVAAGIRRHLPRAFPALHAHRPGSWPKAWCIGPRRQATPASVTSGHLERLAGPVIWTTANFPKLRGLCLANYSAIRTSRAKGRRDLSNPQRGSCNGPHLRKPLTWDDFTMVVVHHLAAADTQAGICHPMTPAAPSTPVPTASTVQPRRPPITARAAANICSPGRGRRRWRFRCHFDSGVPLGADVVQALARRRRGHSAGLRIRGLHWLAPDGRCMCCDPLLRRRTSSPLTGIPLGDLNPGIAAWA